MDQKQKTEIRIHFGLLLAEVICIPAFIFELSRALGGNTLSWAYVFEWPILGLYAIYVWRKLLREERGEITPKPAALNEQQDQQLDEWNAYLAKVHGLPQPEGDA
jgi:hypothetical protein